MRRHAQHTEDSAREVYTAVKREEANVARHLRWVKAQAVNERVCKDTALVQRVVRSLRTPGDHNFKQLAMEHGIPHHTIMHIWRTHL